LEDMSDMMMSDLGKWVHIAEIYITNGCKKVFLLINFRWRGRLAWVTKRSFT
jgi:hypothetical protein